MCLLIYNKSIDVMPSFPRFASAAVRYGSSSSFVPKMPPLFAIARVPGWCAHRVEEVIFANRIIRPAYKYLGVRQKYKPIEER